MESSARMSDSAGTRSGLGSIGAWLFGGLTLAGAAAMLYTWFQPWWIAYIEELRENGVVIYPHAMNISGTLRSYPQWIIGAEMPPWFFPLMWVYLGVMLLALFASLFYTNEWFKLGKFKLSMAQSLIAVAGILYIIYVVVFPIVVAIRAPDFHGVPLQGNVFISMDDHTESYVITSLQSGYWMACVVGPFLVALALLRNKIFEKL